MARATIKELAAKFNRLKANYDALEKMYRSCCEQSDGIADENAKLSGELANASKIISDLTNQMHFINAVQKATRKTDEAGFEAMSESLQQSLADILGLKFKDNN